MLYTVTIRKKPGITGPGYEDIQRTALADNPDDAIRIAKSKVIRDNPDWTPSMLECTNINTGI